MLSTLLGFVLLVAGSVAAPSGGEASASGLEPTGEASAPEPSSPGSLARAGSSADDERSATDRGDRYEGPPSSSPESELPGSLASPSNPDSYAQERVATSGEAPADTTEVEVVTSAPTGEAPVAAALQPGQAPTAVGERANELPGSQTSPDNPNAAPRGATPAIEADAAEPQPPAPKYRLELTPGLRYWIRGNALLVDNFDRQSSQAYTDVRQQARLHMTARYGPLQVFLQFQDSRLWGIELSPVSNEALTDLHQGYLQMRGEDEASDLWGEIRIGRQEIPFGSRRLIAERPWNLVGQSFDSVRVRGHLKRWELDGWFAVTRRPQQFTAPSGELDEEGVPIELDYNSTTSFMGGLQITGAFMPGFNVTGQVLGVRRQPQPETPEITRDIATAGLRILGTPVDGLFYELELFYQGGEQVGRKHSAGAGAAVLDYTFKQVKTKPTLHAGYTIATGEACDNAPGEARCTESGASTEFWDFYARRHGYNGYADLALMRNMRNLELGGWLEPAKGLRLETKYHFFQLQNPQGAWWSTQVEPVGAGWEPGNTQRNLGHEVDLVLSYLPWKNHIKIQPGYALYIPVAAGRRIGGGSDPRHFLYLLLLTQF